MARGKDVMHSGDVKPLERYIVLQSREVQQPFSGVLLTSIETSR